MDNLRLANQGSRSVPRADRQQRRSITTEQAPAGSELTHAGARARIIRNKSGFRGRERADYIELTQASLQAAKPGPKSPKRPSQLPLAQLNEA
ncbi:MAG: hypothetical protein K2X27_09525 [Candidatus Obscuribacterales bacterium]|nr:hypothetical protein [Candidatus Obscuribacterales bacterium]